jgi:hypothetical protein
LWAASRIARSAAVASRASLSAVAASPIPVTAQEAIGWPAGDQAVKRYVISAHASARPPTNGPVERANPSMAGSITASTRGAEAASGGRASSGTTRAKTEG